MEDTIEEIGIDEESRLYLKPAIKTFPMIYREAMEVYWNSDHGYLCGGIPRKWSHLDWYHQILKAALEQGCKLVISPSVKWVNVSEELQAKIAGDQSA